ncbi:hypothetical protein HNQ94_001159 [Salirhabdus euzebyi]|uniref:YpjP-like protein n=1 Tax=Salirhabdus euzebyi TaxID=394506 RepID=A0A841Q269_9BACI|nr:YpjP family protein [Salirhabdus euzebyi]MBB6452713.1 hypothetical protein [Salirhabdus euzebyi]
MKLWFRKVSVILITILTLGLYIPPTYLSADPAENEEVASPKEEPTLLDDSPFETDTDDHQPNNDYLSQITVIAKNATISKLGPRIFDQVEEDVFTNILPTMEEIISSILEEGSEDVIPYYGISEQTTRGYGEKIFNLYDGRTNEDIARFHVRRDNRPGEGYWFNFHYHLNTDNFEKHHVIGEIFWDKNTPPKWMS